MVHTQILTPWLSVNAHSKRPNVLELLMQADRHACQAIDDVIFEHHVDRLVVRIEHLRVTPDLHRPQLLVY